ncbi:MAG: transposase [Thermoleophilaceae bacterium]|nr:transposase [Thermoleophilaceae bacterium]
MSLLAQDLIAWAQALCLDGELAACEPKSLRHRLLHTAARLAFHARRATLRRQRNCPGGPSSPAPSGACAPSHSQPAPSTSVTTKRSARVVRPEAATASPAARPRRMSATYPLRLTSRRRATRVTWRSKGGASRSSRARRHHRGGRLLNHAPAGVPAQRRPLFHLSTTVGATFGEMA